MVEPDYMSGLIFEQASHTYRVNGRLVPHITEVIPSNYDHINPAVLEKARQRGHVAHKLTELYDLHRLDWSKVDEDVLPRLQAWIKARIEYEIEFEDQDIERRLYHPLDGYAGTSDRPRAWIKPPNQKRQLVTIELKTIAKMDDNVQMQVASQVRAENYRARTLGIPEVEGGCAFQLKANGDFKFYPYSELKYYERTFLNYLGVLKHEVRIGKRQYAVQGVRVGASNGKGK